MMRSATIHAHGMYRREVEAQEDTGSVSFPLRGREVGENVDFMSFRTFRSSEASEGRSRFRLVTIENRKKLMNAKFDGNPMRCT